jgi:hypothetical protein
MPDMETKIVAGISVTARDGKVYITIADDRDPGMSFLQARKLARFIEFAAEDAHKQEMRKPEQERERLLKERFDDLVARSEMWK